ncbi:MAG: desulfoferrodoxin [Actinobacteria bacterium]|nr:desulfoferrodoxin [Actinomycetota bacterium]
MTKLNQIYKCNVCGNIVEILHTGAGELVCCNEPMKLQEENAVDAAIEKHIPIIEKTDNGILVKVGSVPHPMEEKHFIEWIELLVDGKAYKQFLSPGDNPQAEFCAKGENIQARAYCNLHGLWKS